MIFKQIHSLPTNPDWGKLLFVGFSLLVAGLIIKQVLKPNAIKTEPKPKEK